MVSHQASWLRRWTRSKRRQGDSPAVIPSNIPIQPCQLLGHEEKKTPTSKATTFNRSTDSQIGDHTINKRDFHSSILHAIRKERPWAPTPLQSTLIKDQTDRPDRSKSHVFPFKKQDLVTRTEIMWPDHHENWKYMARGPMWRNRRLHHQHPLHLLLSSDEERTTQSTRTRSIKGHRKSLKMRILLPEPSIFIDAEAEPFLIRNCHHIWKDDWISAFQINQIWFNPATRSLPSWSQNLGH